MESVLTVAHASYQAYLLRCWQEEGAPHFMLEEVFGARRRWLFESATALATYLSGALVNVTLAPGDGADSISAD